MALWGFLHVLWLPLSWSVWTAHAEPPLDIGLVLPLLFMSGSGNDLVLVAVGAVYWFFPLVFATGWVWHRATATDAKQSPAVEPFAQG